MKVNFSFVLLVIFLSMSFGSVAQKSNDNTKFSLPYEKFTLENGLEVVLHEDHSDPIVAVATVMHVGSNREKPGKTGFAHFFEHMSFNDSENAPVGANRKLIPQWGGERNGGTWSDGTMYYEVVPKDAFDKILWIDSDRLGYMIKTVTEEALAREIQVVKNEKRENYDNRAYGFTGEIIRRNLYPANHPYSWTVIGSLPDLQAATLADVQEFYNQYYGAGNATLVIAGDINIAETKEKVRRWFGEIRKGPEVKPIGPMPVKLGAIKSVYYEDNFAKLPELRMVFPTVENYHNDTYALEVLGQLLSANRTSPLYEIIVEQKKLAPSVSSYQSSDELAGEFIIRVRGNADTSLEDVKNSVVDALHRFETKGFSDQDLTRIRAKIETQLYSKIETVLNKALQMGTDNEFIGNPAYVTVAAEKSRGVSHEDVMRVYNQYIKGKPYVMTSVVPKGRKDLVATDAVIAEIEQEKVVNNVQNEQVGQGKEAVFEKTPSKYDRSEPPFLETPLFKSPAIWTSSLKNGLKIYGIDNREIPLVTFNIRIPGGHYIDSIDKPGVASLMAQMMMQGTAKRTPAQLEEAIDLLGADIYVRASAEEITVEGSCLARNFEPTLALVKEILLEPRWDEAEYTRLKSALATALKDQQAEPSLIASSNFARLLYGPQHILAYPIRGTIDSADKITMTDLKEFYSRNISPVDASFHFVGAVDKDRVTKALKSFEKSWSSKAVSMPKYAVNPTASGNVFFIDVPNAKQSVLYIGKLALTAENPESSKLTYANDLLGGGSSGRLFQTLRIEKGFTYGAFSSVVSRKDLGPLVVSTSVRANATLPSLEIIREMLQNYGMSFTDKDVKTTQDKILKSNTLQYEELQSKLGMLQNISKYSKPFNYVEADQKELLGMSLADFKSVISRYMSEKNFIYVIVGDKATQFDNVSKFANGNVVELDIKGMPVRK